jgi:cbb3-type cytochrome oxidase maturation protein
VSVIFVVLPLALIIVGAAVWAYVWAARQGQFDDLDTPAVRMLRDDQPAARQGKKSTVNSPKSEVSDK